MSEPSASSDRDPGPDEAYCRNCGSIISERAEICPDCGVRQRPPPQSSIESTVDSALEGGNPVVAAILSALFPGLGQIYNRELMRGIAFIVGALLAMGSTMFLVGFLLYPAIWVYAIYDAYVRAERGPDRRRADDAGRRDRGSGARDERDTTSGDWDE
ncbi:zinc ribbon domain-containing protein [Halomicrobium salinisoli]|uniref:zinc ribbon domain-containing protein n=1 Tax=Halomicrobium salinisoli TaxID=2878391 RepID=UPI001CEFB66D|nr:zinc ribbon domain-containing protein [Halomicrobium salinisoli]